MLYEAELVGETDRLELRELNIFLGKNYLGTVHSRPIRAIETAKRLWHEWRIVQNKVQVCSPIS